MTHIHEQPQRHGGREDLRVDYLRLSVTDRCNLRCAYCMPPEGVPPRDHRDILSYEELATFTRAAAAIGIAKVRITGGEPLVRKGCADLVGMLAATPGIADVSLTTNGLLLPRYARALRDAGLRRVNLSIDSLQPERFARITRGGRVGDALAGLDAAFAVGFAPVKVNTVLLHGVEDELDDLVGLTMSREVHLRFIEYMPVDRRHGADALLVPAGLVLERLRERYDLAPVDGPYGHGPARYWRVPGASGTVGFIAGVTDHFCADCNRLRLTADGRLRTCLFSGEEVDVRPLLARPEKLEAVLLAVLAAKVYDRRAERRPNERTMSQIGG
jgi:cyclic pyranopterin phosphate synthase